MLVVQVSVNISFSLQTAQRSPLVPIRTREQESLNRLNVMPTIPEEVVYFRDYESNQNFQENEIAKQTESESSESEDKENSAPVGYFDWVEFAKAQKRKFFNIIGRKK